MKGNLLKKRKAIDCLFYVNRIFLFRLGSVRFQEETFNGEHLEKAENGK